MLTSEGLRYTWEQICQRAGLSLQVSLEEIVLHYGEFTIGIVNDKLKIRVFRSTEQQWLSLVNSTDNSINRVDAKSVIPAGIPPFVDERIPILFPANEETLPAHLIEYDPEQHCLTINFDIIAAAYIMLTRWEETVIQARDQHNRFPATASIAYRQGFLSRPIVDEYALILRQWLSVLLPELPLTTHKFQLQISHDIDHLGKSGNPVLDGVRMLKNYLLHWDKEIFLDDARHIADGHGITPNNWAAEQLVKWAGELNYRPRFYFMTAAKSAYDEGYDLATAENLELLNTISKSGYEIGLHASYVTMQNLNLLKREKERLEDVLQSPVTSVRQHYLRIQTPETWRLWQNAGFLHDSSLGYSDAPGFRCGTCHPYKLFDVENDHELDVMEEPLIVMDTTLFSQMKYSQPEEENEILELAMRCKSVNGVFNLLWHNTSLFHTRYHWGQFFHRLIPRLLN